MTKHYSRDQQALLWLTCGLSAIVLTAGCDAPVANYEQNRVFWAIQNRQLDEESRLSSEQRQNLVDVMAALFGTPDAPTLPELPETDLADYIDIAKLEQSAGPVGRDEQGRRHGLYREHCVHCHGVTGNAKGPTSVFLNPYPRDFTRGVFKFKSTPGQEPPTHDDLMRILRNGVAGTAMPSFKLLDGDELESLAHYVKYLSLRGQVERELILFLTQEAETGDMVLDVDNVEVRADQMATIREIVAMVAEQWMAAEPTAIEQRTISDDPTEIAEVEDGQQQLDASIERGRELFFGQAGCVKCHGTTALGDGVQDDYDIWNKELQPDNPEALEEYLALGALPPRNIIPRNLRQGVFRGGRRPIDIFWRVRNGIVASTMPAQNQLSDEQVWDIVNYVRSLQYEQASEPRTEQPAFQRDRS